MYARSQKIQARCALKNIFWIDITHLTENKCEKWVNTNMGAITHFPLFPQTYKSTTVLNHVGQTKISHSLVFMNKKFKAMVFLITALLWWEENSCSAFILNSVSPVRGDCLHLAKCFHICASFKTTDLFSAAIINAETMTTFCVVLIYLQV